MTTTSTFTFAPVLAPVRTSPLWLFPISLALMALAALLPGCLCDDSDGSSGTSGTSGTSTIVDCLPADKCTTAFDDSECPGLTEACADRQALRCECQPTAVPFACDPAPVDCGDGRVGFCCAH